VVYDLNLLSKNDRGVMGRYDPYAIAYASMQGREAHRALRTATAAPGARTMPDARKQARGERLGLYGLVGKRFLDCLFILIALPVVLPVVMVLALLVALDGGSAFYWQQRVGRNGRAFRIMKLRTMVPDADKTLEAHLNANPAARREWDHKQKLSDDPRITEIGHFLRSTSLDELPQLWNVLKGEMSLVGPRPMMLDQARIYPDMACYTQMRPGITGLWQVADRNDSGFADRAAFDAAYLKSMSLFTDMRILLRTVGVVIRRTGC
jgi:lipopolysaccharide/colanic/teichoic acid biosynthesis glycosyltransferase